MNSHEKHNLEEFQKEISELENKINGMELFIEENCNTLTVDEYIDKSREIDNLEYKLLCLMSQIEGDWANVVVVNSNYTDRNMGNKKSLNR